MLKYKWINDKLIKVDDDGQEVPASPLLNRKGNAIAASGVGLDPMFIPEYEIVCDGYNDAEKNVEPRNFTLSLSAIKNVNNLDQTNARGTGGVFDDIKEIDTPRTKSIRDGVGNGIIVTQPTNGINYYQQYNYQNNHSYSLAGSKASHPPSYSSRNNLVTQNPLIVSSQVNCQQQVGLPRR